ncbi:MAG: type II toxin-antitoxin system HicA family toxin [Pseudomonadota bacterium]|nr:type II toxin-antitoxin system HicA family toxin [Pseudomonadota bacterium]
MTRPDKLYAQLARSPEMIISYRDFMSIHAAFGFERRPGKGSHTNWKHPNVPKLLTSQPNGKDAVPYQVKRLLAVIEEYDLQMVG